MQSSKQKATQSVRPLLWYHRDSNLGHTDFQSVALPTELWYQNFGTANIRKFLSTSSLRIVPLRGYASIGVLLTVCE